MAKTFNELPKISELEERDLLAQVYLRNTSDEDIADKWDGRPFVIKAGETMPAPRYLAYSVMRHRAAKESYDVELLEADEVSVTAAAPKEEAPAEEGEKKPAKKTRKKTTKKAKK